MKTVFVVFLNAILFIGCGDTSSVPPSVERDRKNAGQLTILLDEGESFTYSMSNTEGMATTRTIESIQVDHIKPILTEAQRLVKNKGVPFSVRILLDQDTTSASYRNTKLALQELSIEDYEVLRLSK
ncbi:hypothetical protein [Paraflavitalea sp. CAU 1676]|uniref:hypothetical protein n=1 Tax=Paraflavitalea sp. CAU 1676 TaxID=3032598 RepID=UPI0023DC968B|nr:hypothetical protein [Paraflavitalea sp. CAU 1676]MDF2188804.1 hypothetical protein [Paraflavitalea sp. CAU 1676]